MGNPRLLTAPGVTLLLAMAAAAGAAEVEGRFTLGDEAIQPAHAVAIEGKGGDGALTVVLSEAPIDTEAALSALDPLTAIVNQVSNLDANLLVVSVGADATASVNAMFTDGMRQFVATTRDGSLKVEWDARGADRLAGRAFTPAPVPTRGGPAYALDVRFDVPVARRSGGTALPEGGGAPGAALLELLAAVEAGDLAAIRSRVSEDLAADFDASYNTPEENLESARDRLGASLPKGDAAVRGGTVFAEEAILEVTGTLFEDTRALYRVRMVKRDGGWVFDAGLMSGLLD